MNLFNKYEAIGIFLSIAIMAVALGVIRFKTDVFALNTIVDSETQGAVVAVSEKDPGDTQLSGALREASTADGTIVKLVVDDIRVGSGSAVKKGDTLTVHYIGTKQDGERFDSSYERAQPFTYTVGVGTVIKGWEEGLIGMQAGGQRILVIPSEMAYGNRQVGVIPPNSVLVFAIELLSIN